MGDLDFSSIGGKGALVAGARTVSQSVNGEPSPADKKKAKDTAQDFEALLLRILLNTMRDATMKGGLFGGNLASDVYEDMFYSEVADLMAHSEPGLGIADIVYDDIIRLGNYDVSAPEGDVDSALTSLEFTSPLTIESYGAGR